VAAARASRVPYGSQIAAIRLLPSLAESVRARLGALLVVAMIAAFFAGSAAASVPPAPPRFLQTLDVKSSGLAFAVGDTVILQTRNSGSTWRSSRVTGVSGVGGATFLDATNWLVAGASSTGTASVSVLRTSDAGVRWRRSVLPRGYPDGHGSIAFSFADARHGWLTVETVHGSAFANVDLYRSDDGGASWRYLGGHAFTGPILFLGSRGFALGGPEPNRLYTTSDGGTAWTPVALPVPPALRGESATLALPQLLTGTDRELGLAAWYAKPIGISGTRNTVVVYRSGDGGRHWLATTPVSDSGFGNYGIGTPIPVAFTDRTHWWIGGSLTLYASSDAGRAWRSFRPNTGSTGLFGLIGAVQLAFPTTRLGYALIQYGHCREFKRACTERSFVLRSSDAGRSWTVLTLEGSLAGIARCQSNQLTASANFGGATGSALGGATIVNTSTRACTLPVRPTVRILVNGRTVALQRSLPSGAASFPQVPVRLLRPRARAYSSLQWFNWCGERQGTPPRVDVALAIGASPLIAHARDAVLPRCDASSRPSTVWVGDFVESP